MRALVVVAVSVMAALSSPVLADEKTDQAKSLYDAGVKLYDLGKYDDAIARWSRAYEISGEPGLLFNIAQAHRLKGDCTSALRFYRQYLLRQPEAANRTDVESRISEMQKCIDSGKVPEVQKPSEPPVEVPVQEKPPTDFEPPADTAQPPPRELPDATPAPPAAIAEPKVDPHPGRTEKLVGYTAGGLGIVAMGVGAYFAIDAGNKADELSSKYSEPGQWDADARRLEADGESSANSAMILTGVGAVLVAGGAVYYWLGWKQDADAERSRLSAAPIDGGLRVAWSVAF